MARWLPVLISIVLLSSTTGYAQTSTPLPTPTPDVRQMWTLEPGVNAQGTPTPAQDVVFEWSLNAGEAAIALFLFGVIVLAIGGLTLWLVLSAKEDSESNHGGLAPAAAPAPFDRRLAPRERRHL